MARYAAMLSLMFGVVLLVLAGLPARACTLAAPGTTQRITVGTTGRSMLIHVPAGFDPSRPAPLVLLFHGSLGDGATILAKSGMSETADRHGFMVAAPDGGIVAKPGFVWNIPGVPTVSGRLPTADDADDVAFVDAAIDWLAAQRCIDPARVYATGYSGGGRMTSLLGCIRAERFAAIAPVVGLRAGNPLASDPQQPDPATCHPSRPMPVMAFAGSADTTNPIAGGGSSYWQYPMRTAEARWAAIDGCRKPLATRSLSAAVYEDVYGGCRARAEVIGRVTIGAGHVWVADNEAMWAFFARYRR